jgi:hypothetical protein
VGQEGAGDGVEAAQEGARGKGSQSTMRATRRSEPTPGVHTDTGVFSPSFMQTLREETQEEVGREGVGEGVEAA